MKRISLLLALLMAISGSAFAQSTLPRPLNPTVDDWLDYEPYIVRDTITGEPVEFNTSCQLMFSIGMDLMGNPVADDYPGFMGDVAITDTLTYTYLIPEYVSYSVFTDFDEEFVFTPEIYSEFEEPTTRIPFGFEGPDFEMWFVHFPGMTNHVEPLLEAGFDVEPICQWRIGIRTNYIVGDQATYSDIVYWEICDKPVSLLGDVNDDGKVGIADVTSLIDYILDSQTFKIQKFNSDVNGDNKIDISDITALVDLIVIN